MHTEKPSASSFFSGKFSARTLPALALAAFATFSYAQQPAAQVDSASQPALDLSTHTDLIYGSSVSSSSSDYANPEVASRLDLVRTDAPADLPADPSEALQPPPRRRYGRPRYNDSNHNPDGSNKYGFVIGGGLTIPTGNTYHYLNTNYAIQVGVGRNFSAKSSLFAQFDYDRFGFQGSTLANQGYLYDPTGSGGIKGNLDGSSHVWSFSIDPSHTLIQNDTHSAYVVGGVGFYHKTANFTVPATGIEYYYGIPIQVTANETIDKYTSNAPGFSGGFGLTYKFSRFANERFFVEGRYVIVLNSQRHGITYANSSQYGYPTTSTYSGNVYYPANSNRTTYIPIKAGIRF